MNQNDPFRLCLRGRQPQGKKMYTTHGYSHMSYKSFRPVCALKLQSSHNESWISAVHAMIQDKLWFGMVLYQKIKSFCDHTCNCENLGVRLIKIGRGVDHCAPVQLLNHCTTIESPEKKIRGSHFSLGPIGGHNNTDNTKYIDLCFFYTDCTLQ